MLVSFPGGEKVNVDFDGYSVKTDQSIEHGGEATSPNPFQYLFVALAAYAGHSASSFYLKRGVDTQKMKLEFNYQVEPDTKLLTNVEIFLNVDSSFPEKYDKAVLKAIDLCTVKKQIRPEVNFKSTIKRIN